MAVSDGHINYWKLAEKVLCLQAIWHDVTLAKNVDLTKNVEPGKKSSTEVNIRPIQPRKIGVGIRWNNIRWNTHLKHVDWTKQNHGMLFNLYTKGCSFLHSNMDPRRQNTRSHYVKEIQIMETLSFGRGLYMDNKNIRSCINIPTKNNGHKSTQFEWVISALATRLSIRFGEFWSSRQVWGSPSFSQWSMTGWWWNPTGDLILCGMKNM